MTMRWGEGKAQITEVPSDPGTEFGFCTNGCKQLLENLA